MKKENDLIKNFIKDYDMQGTNRETIKKMLRIQGWSEEEIEAGMKEVGSMPTPEVKKPQDHTIMTNLHTEVPRPGSVSSILKKIVISVFIILIVLAGAAYAFYKFNNPTVLIG